MPKRIQRKRSKGWRKPGGAVYVGRGSCWGNPYPVYESLKNGHGDIISGKQLIRSPQEAVRLYSKKMMPYIAHDLRYNSMGNFLISVAFIESAQYALHGKDLLCWCPLDQPCHADVLLKIANSMAITEFPAGEMTAGKNGKI